MKQIRKAWITKCLGQNYSISPRNKFILREFDRFLLSHSALHDFYQNCNLKSKSRFRPKNFIIQSFIWDATPPDYKFWQKLDKEWNLRLNIILESML